MTNKIKYKYAKIPTDLKILELIYKKYYYDYVSFEKNSKNRESKIFVQINCKDIAKEINVDNDIIFGRLYYLFEEKYGYVRKDGSKVSFFILGIGNDNKRYVNFPLLASVLANLQQDKNKHRTSILLASLAIVISLVSLMTSIYN